MKKYNVECLYLTPEMIKGEEPWEGERMNITGDYTEANSPDEAIDLVIDWMKYEKDSEYYMEVDNGTVIFYDLLGGIIHGNGMFTATEIDS